jgi:hypothetical protein
MNPRARRIRRLRRKWVLCGEIGGPNGHCWLLRRTEVPKIGLSGINRRAFGKPRVPVLAFQGR